MSFDLIRYVVRKVIEGEGWTAKGELSIILANDRILQNLNRRFLNSDRPTDVIAFPLGENDEGPWGEVYISEDRARDQALEYCLPYQEELIRLIIHGVLHLIGYQDETADLRKKMDKKVNTYLECIKE